LNEAGLDHHQYDPPRTLQYYWTLRRSSCVTTPSKKK
jgi:hypothetical protein